MNLTAIAIKNNRVTYLVLLIVIILGMLGYRQLPRDSMPPFTIRVASIVTSFPGASPERVELLITDPIEKVAQEIPEVDYISSESRTGLSVVNVSLKESVPAGKLQPIWDRLRRKIEALEPSLPSGISSGPDLKDEDVGVTYGISVGLKNDGYEYKELEEYAKDLRNKLIKLPDAAKVELGGVLDQRIYIEFNDAELADVGISSNQLKSIISSTNIIIPAGEINLGSERIILEPSGNFESVEDIRNILIPVGNGSKTIFLGDITNVFSGYVSPPKAIVKMDGEPSVSLYISLKENANIIQLGQDVDALLASYNRTLPVGISASRIVSQDTDVNKTVNNFIENLLQSVVIVLFVMFLFLGLRAGVVVASLIPTAIILSLLLMNYFTIGLNQVSLAALIMALGMLVDNAIVMAESMMVKMENGMKSVDAAISSSKELMVPLLTSSLTTSAAFLSFFLADSVMGEMMGQLFSVITLTLLSSWLISLTIVPMLAIVFIKTRNKKPENTKTSFFDRLTVYYDRIIKWSLSHSNIIVGSIIALLALSLFGFTRLPFVFMPDSERNLVTLDLNLPLGTNIATTELEVTKMERFIGDSLLVNEGRKRGITDWSSFIGEGPKSYDLGYQPGEANSGYAHMLINTTSGADNQYIIDQLDAFAFSNIPDAKVVVKQLGTGGGASVPVQLRISGDDPDELLKIASEVKGKLLAIPGTKNVDNNWGPKIKKVFVDIDEAKVNLAGLTNQDIAVSSNTTLSGFTVGEYREGDNVIPISMRTIGSQEISYDRLEGLSIYAQNSGKNVPLAQVADIRIEWQLPKILRRDLDRTITVESQLQGGVTASDITTPLENWLEDVSRNWKVGYTYELGGESESSSRAMQAVMDKLPLSFFIIILLLVMQFNSIRKSTIILMAVPFGLIGVVGGLLITGTNFSFTGFLGLISLSGIVINNAIVLIDRIQIEQDEFGRKPYDAILSASKERFRPILLTTFTTSLGLIPLWLGGGLMWEPLAIGIIFGLLFATLITLVFVPIMYKILFKVKIM